MGQFSLSAATEEGSHPEQLASRKIENKPRQFTKYAPLPKSRNEILAARYSPNMTKSSRGLLTGSRGSATTVQ